jgi:hypothetical protein
MISNVTTTATEALTSPARTRAVTGNAVRQIEKHVEYVKGNKAIKIFCRFPTIEPYPVALIGMSFLGLRLTVLAGFVVAIVV